MKKKLFVCLYSFFPYTIGGREVWLYEMAKRLPPEKYDIVFFTIKNPEGENAKIEMPAEIRKNIIGVPTMRTFISKSKLLRRFFGLPVLKYLMLLDFYIYSSFVRDYFIENYSDENAIFIAPNLGFECMPATSIKKKRPSCKLITLVMGEWLKDVTMTFPAARKIFKRLEFRASRSTDILVYQTRTHFKRENERLGIEEEKVRIIPFGGVDPSLFRLPGTGQRDACRKKLGLSEDDFVLVNVAIIRKLKGQDVLIKSLSKTKIKNKAVLLLVGRGEKRAVERLLNNAASGLRVRYLGWKNRAELVDILWASDVFVLPSLSEALPIALMEALASGLPVIATDVGGVSEIVENGGEIIPIDDPSALAQAIEKIYYGLESYKNGVRSSRDEFIRKYAIETGINAFDNLLDGIQI